MGQYTQQIGTTARIRLNDPQDREGRKGYIVNPEKGEIQNHSSLKAQGYQARAVSLPACPHPAESGASSDLSLITA